MQTVKLKLIEADGSMHGSTRNIVLSAAEGEGIEMKFVDPVQR